MTNKETEDFGVRDSQIENESEEKNEEGGKHIELTLTDETAVKEKFGG